MDINSANTCSLLKPCRSMALVRHADTHVPQPWQRPGFTLATVFMMSPARFLIGSSSMAWYGHAVLHRKHPTQFENTGGAWRSTTATMGSRVSSGCENRPHTFTAAPLACATVSGMSRGAWHVPAKKMPAVFVSTGRNLGCASAKNLYGSYDTCSVCAS